jgi:cytochrome c-type biogenesis protein CcmE
MRSRIRFIIAIALAAVLGGALLYVSLGGAMETYTSPAQLLAAEDAQGKTYRLNGNVIGVVPDDAVARARRQDGPLEAGHRRLPRDDPGPVQGVARDRGDRVPR